MTVYETDLPGVGRKFDLDLDAGGVASVIVHHDGRCELYHRPARDGSGEKLLDLNGEEANRLGSILEGAYFESVNVDALSVPLGDAIIEWVEVAEGSSFDGTTLAEGELKRDTGATVIAVQRGEETVSYPDADFELAGGDLLVAIGTHQEQAALKERVQD